MPARLLRPWTLLTYLAARTALARVPSAWTGSVSRRRASTTPHAVPAGPLHPRKTYNIAGLIGPRPEQDFVASIDQWVDQLVEKWSPAVREAMAH